MPLPPTVIVADADRDCANAVAMLLSGAGITPRVAYGGRDAIVLANECNPVCAVIDVAMPDVSGLDVARHLRARYGNDVRIVGYTAWTGLEDRHRATEAGFEQVVAKDADPLDLLGALSAATHAVVKRSLNASRRQMRLQLDLAAALIDQSWLTPDPSLAARTRGVVVRTLDAVDVSLGRLPLGPAERTELAVAVAALRQRIPGAGPE
jgi:DNA-binding response OmpR family regulator